MSITDLHSKIRRASPAVLHELDALRAENMRLREERDTAIEAEKIALREIGAENEDLKRRLAAQDDVVLAARATVAAAHRRGNDIETGLVSGLHDALRRAGLEKLY